MSVYKKEIRSTIGFGVVYLLLAHTGLFAIYFGVDNDSRILGFPIHYFVAILLGTLGVLIWSIIWTSYANNLENQLDEENKIILKEMEK